MVSLLVQINLTSWPEADTPVIAALPTPSIAPRSPLPSSHHPPGPRIYGYYGPQPFFGPHGRAPSHPMSPPARPHGRHPSNSSASSQDHRGLPGTPLPPMHSLARSPSVMDYDMGYDDQGPYPYYGENGIAYPWIGASMGPPSYQAASLLHQGGFVPGYGGQQQASALHQVGSGLSPGMRGYQVGSPPQQHVGFVPQPRCPPQQGLSHQAGSAPTPNRQQQGRSSQPAGSGLGLRTHHIGSTPVNMSGQGSTSASSDMTNPYGTPRSRQSPAAPRNSGQTPATARAGSGVSQRVYHEPVATRTRGHGQRAAERGAAPIHRCRTMTRESDHGKQRERGPSSDEDAEGDDDSTVPQLA